MQQLNPFGTEFGCDLAHACDVALRPIETGYETSFDGVIADKEHNWDCRGRSFRRLRNYCTADRSDQCDAPAHQLGSERWQAFVMALSEAILDCEVLAFGKADLSKASADCSDEFHDRHERTAAKEPDRWYPWLLRPRHERPHRWRSTDERHEIA